MRIATLVLIVCSLLVAPVEAAPATDPDRAADLAAAWVADQLAGQGDVAATIDAALALAAAGIEQASFDAAVSTVETAAAEYLGDADSDAGGDLGELLLLADAAGEDPRDFGGVDLVGRLEDTLGAVEEGRYAERDDRPAPVVDQSLAILGLVAAGRSVPAAATDWLVDRQCSHGAFPQDDCGDSAGHVPATALAVQALAGSGAGDEARNDALAWLRRIQNDDGGLGETPGSRSGPRPTALTVQAVVASGGDPQSAEWAGPEGASLVDHLRSIQLGCRVVNADRGGLPVPGAPWAADLDATTAATPGLAMRAFPLGETTFGSSPSPLDCPFDVRRVAGPDRTATAQAIARTAYPAGASVLVVANAFRPPDALAAAPLAAVLDAPVLTVARDALPDGFADTARDLGVRRAVIVGGPAAVEEGVADALRDLGLAVERVAGRDRFATAAAVADRLAQATGKAPTTAFVAEGWDPDPARGWPDALAVGALAGHLEAPILLVTTDTVPPPTAKAAEGLRAVTVVGGTAAVSDAVLRRLDELAGRVDRLAGADRYATARRVVDAALEVGVDPSTSWFVTGGTFADALPAGAAAGATGELLMLVDGSVQSLEVGPAGEVAAAVSDQLEELRAVGGPAAVSRPAVAGLAAAAGA